MFFYRHGFQKESAAPAGLMQSICLGGAFCILILEVPDDELNSIYLSF